MKKRQLSRAQWMQLIIKYNLPCYWRHIPGMGRPQGDWELVAFTAQRIPGSQQPERIIRYATSAERAAHATARMMRLGCRTISIHGLGETSIADKLILFSPVGNRPAPDYEGFAAEYRKLTLDNMSDVI